MGLEQTLDRLRKLPSSLRGVERVHAVDEIVDLPSNYSASADYGVLKLRALGGLDLSTEQTAGLVAGAVERLKDINIVKGVATGIYGHSWTPDEFLAEKTFGSLFSGDISIVAYTHPDIGHFEDSKQDNSRLEAHRFSFDDKIAISVSGEYRRLVPSIVEGIKATSIAVRLSPEEKNKVLTSFTGPGRRKIARDSRKTAREYCMPERDVSVGVDLGMREFRAINDFLDGKYSEDYGPWHVEKVPWIPFISPRGSLLKHMQTVVRTVEEDEIDGGSPPLIHASSPNYDVVSYLSGLDSMARPEQGSLDRLEIFPTNRGNNPIFRTRLSIGRTLYSSSLSTIDMHIPLTGENALRPAQEYVLNELGLINS